MGLEVLQHNDLEPDWASTDWNKKVGSDEKLDEKCSSEQVDVDRNVIGYEEATYK